MTIPTLRPDPTHQLKAMLNQLNEETSLLSSTNQRANHRLYKLLLEQSSYNEHRRDALIKLILHRFAWGYVNWNELALIHQLTNYHPFADDKRPEQRGKVYLMAKTWLEWGENWLSASK